MHAGAHQSILLVRLSSLMKDSTICMDGGGGKTQSVCIRRDCYAGNVGWGCACPPCAPRPPPAKLKRLRKSARPAHPAHQCCQELEGGEACALHLCTRLLLLVCTRAHLNNGRQDVKHWVRELLLPLNHLAGWWGQSMAGWAAGRAMHAASDQGGGRQLVGCRQQAAIGLKFQVKLNL